MKRELEHFYIGNSYGGNQDWFRTFMMRIGGCGAETACDSSLYFAIHRGIDYIYPFDSDNLSKEDYVEFAHMMEKYLWPRMSGIYKLSIYVEGYSKYLNDRAVSCIGMDTLDGSEPYETAADAVKKQIDEGYPIPTLILNHKEKSLKDYVWHWFLINGYDERDTGLMVKAVTYSGYEWLDLRTLWDSGHSTKGGLILYNERGKKMNNEKGFITEENRIYMIDDGVQLLAEITFPETADGEFTIDHTFVDESLRGQGMASKLVQAAVDEIESRGGIVKATCSYAMKWLEKNKY